MTTLETITRELERIRQSRGGAKSRCHAIITMEIAVNHFGVIGPEFEITMWDSGYDIAEGKGETLSDAWRAFQNHFNGPDPKSLIRQADAEMGNVPDQASELRRQAAEKPHPKAGLWNGANQTPGCWAISPRGECYFVDSYGDLSVECLTPDDLDRAAVPNTWPIPEAAKPKLRGLGVPFDDAPEPVRGLGADAIAIELEEMEAALSRPDRFDAE